MGGGSHTGSNQSTTAQPYGPAAQPANRLLGAAGNLMWNQTNPLGAYQVAPFTGAQDVALGGAQNTYGGAQALSDLGAAQQAATMGGQYLDPASNPELQAYYNAASQGLVNQFQNATAPGITGQMLRSGNLDSTARGLALGQAQYGLGQNLTNLAAQIYEPAYQQERQMQQQSALSAPSTAAGLFQPAQQLYGFGSAEQQQVQNVLDAARKTQNQAALWPYQQLGLLQGVVSPFFGSGGTNVTVGSGVSSK